MSYRHNFLVFSLIIILRCCNLIYFLLQVKFSPNANLYTTCSKDGHIKIWDGVSSLCINTFKNAHDGQEVCSVLFTRNSKVRQKHRQKYVFDENFKKISLYSP